MNDWGMDSIRRELIAAQEWLAVHPAGNTEKHVIPSLGAGSTLAEAVASYAENASHEEEASRAQALAFITACRWLLISRPPRIVPDSVSAKRHLFRRRGFSAVLRRLVGRLLRTLVGRIDS